MTELDSPPRWPGGTRRTPRRLLAALGAAGAAVAVMAGAAVVAPVPAADASTSAGSTFYVNCAAKQAGNGTLQHPWRSTATVTAHAAFRPGDRILFKRSTTCRGQLKPKGAGTAGHPIIIGAYGAGARPAIAGGGTSAKTGTIQLHNPRYITVQDLHITNKTKAKYPRSYRSGVLVTNTGAGYLHGVTLQRLQIDSVRSSAGYTSGNPRWFGGISVITTGVRTDGFVGMKILNNRISGASRTGIAVINTEYSVGLDRQLRISGNTIRKARGDSIIVQGASGARIDHNLSADGANLWPCPECKGVSPHTANAAIWPIYSRNVQIDHNEVYGEHDKGGDGEAISVDASTRNVVVEYNYVHDNRGGGILFCGSLNASARFNILENNKRSAFAFIGTYPAKKTAIYNNTVYNSRTSNARVVRYFNGARGSGISFKNNIVFNYSIASYQWPKRPTTAANTLVGAHGKGRPTDKKTSFANPQLKKPGSGRNGMKTLGGYKPKHPKTFKRGVAIPKSVTVDFFGKRINPKRPPRGAAG